ncbi:hypothetical protein MMC17_008776 [Xylographa soralifera]|nr:hypothetical protein [Xylographa soralifera]
MAPLERRTYFGYREGLDPSVMTLGSLLFDYTNPRTKRPYIHEDLSSAATEQWCLVDERSSCYIAYKGDNRISFGVGLNDLAAIDTNRSGSSYSVVASPKGSRVELKEPEVFFTNQVLTDQKARFWLQSRLSVASWLKLRKGLTERSPRIWLLTGLYFMEDASFLDVFDSGSSFGVEGAAPIPEPSGIASLLQLSVGARAKIGSRNVAVASSKVLGKKVWAAQFQLVRAKYVTEHKWNDASVHILRLVDVFSLETRRVANTKGNAAEVDLADAILDDEDAEEGQIMSGNNAYWEEFEKRVKHIEDE